MDKHVCINIRDHIFEPYILWKSWKGRLLFRYNTIMMISLGSSRQIDLSCSVVNLFYCVWGEGGGANLS